MIKRILLIISLSILKLFSIQHTNFFEPYEWLLDANRLFLLEENCHWQTNIRAEYGFNFQGYPIDPKELLINSYNLQTIKSNPTNYLNPVNSLYSSFLGQITKNTLGQFAQQYTHSNGMTASELVQFKGDLSLMSFTGQIEYWLHPHLKIGYYLPFYSLKLRSLNHEIEENKEMFEHTITNDLFKEFTKNTNTINPYQMKGLGDSTLLFSWQRYFYENRDFISGLLASLRIGLYLPTGFYRESFIETFLKIPFGYDAGWGIPFGGSIELDLGCYAGAGISADCITFFGKLMPRYIKSDMRQSDMLLLEKCDSIIYPGFKESFSVYITAHDLDKTFLATAAYQYNKQNESDIILCDSSYVNLIAQTSDFLESWTAHNLLLNFQGETTLNNIYTTYSLFFKLGFHGMRSIIANTCGLQINMNF